MKIVVLFSFYLLAISYSTTAQNRYWVFPPNSVDMKTGTVSPIPSNSPNNTYVPLTDLVTNTFGAYVPPGPLSKSGSTSIFPAFAYSGHLWNQGQPSVTFYSANGIFDQFGNIQFYLNNEAIEVNGATYRDRGYYDTQMPIIPVPQTCGSFYIFNLLNCITSTPGQPSHLNY